MESSRAIGLGVPRNVAQAALHSPPTRERVTSAGRSYAVGEFDSLPRRDRFTEQACGIFSGDGTALTVRPLADTCTGGIDVAQATCSVDGCLKRCHGRGLCSTHYRRLRAGIDLTAPMVIVGDDDARFWSYVDFTPGCWFWTGWLNADGYAPFQLRRRAMRVHRWAYERWVGPIPEGLEIDHLCRVRHCVNPTHLEPVTQAENKRRGAEARISKTHCVNGHPRTPGNWYVVGERTVICRICDRAAGARWRAKKRAS